jgi:hypothetical protein
MNEKYAEMPGYLSERIFKGVAFLYAQHLKNPHSPNLPEEVKQRLEFLEKSEGYTRQEIRYVLLLLSLPEIDEVLAKSNILEEAFAAKLHSLH